MVMNNTKKEVRQSLLRRLLSLTCDEIIRRSEDVERLLSELPIYRKAKVILVYFPLKGEVNLLGLIRRDWEVKEFCFPVMDLNTKGLTAFKASSLDRGFMRGDYGVMEPCPETRQSVDLNRVDLVIVPGLGFDREKNRLGRGKGFYDRFLKTVKPPIAKVGVAFECQIQDHLPSDPAWDEKVDFVVGEKSIL